MKRLPIRAVLLLTVFALLPLQAKATELLIPVGKVIGLQLRSEAITVAAYDDALGGNARDAGLKIGDEIVMIGSQPVESAEDVRSFLNEQTVELTIRRGGKLTTLQITPQQTADGPRLGIYLRQGIAGIGTVTFYNPKTGLFGTLGHGVCDSKGKLLQMTEGCAYEASILSVRKGCSGEPGQLKGSADSPVPFAQLLKNTPQGVFGIHRQGWKGEPLPTAAYEEIETGPAMIRSTVSDGTPKEYSVEVLKIYPKARTDGRNFLIRVTDPALLEATGGIVQGMSGSPIIQNGKLVGAVTHVLVNDPTMGYGIFIQNMLDAAA